MARGKKATTGVVSRESRQKRKRFAAEYLIDLNATQAAIRAGYSSKTAYSQGQRLLKDAEVQQWIQEGMAARAERVGFTQDQVLEELGYLNFSDLSEVLDVGEGGVVSIRPLHQLPKRVRRAVESITQTVTESFDAENGRRLEKTKTTIKMHSKTAALRMSMDHLGMDAPKKNEHTGKDGKPIQTENKHEHRPAKGLSKDVARAMALKVLGVPIELLPASMAESKPANDAGEPVSEKTSGTA